MATRFTSIGVKLVATVGSLVVVGSAAFAAITATTGTFSGTVTAPTVTNSSGSYTLGNSGLDVTTKVVEARTLSGSYTNGNLQTPAQNHMACYTSTGALHYCTGSGHTLGNCTCA